MVLKKEEKFLYQSASKITFLLSKISANVGLFTNFPNVLALSIAVQHGLQIFEPIKEQWHY
jgi:hypothetical protein